MIKLSKTAKKLFEKLTDIKIIDAHEHLVPEDVRINTKVDVFTLFSHYTHNDLISSGMPREDYDKTQSPDITLEEKFKLISPYLSNTNYNSYTRAVYIALKEFYGFDRITADNYKTISEAIVNANKKGIYKKVLKNKCKIEKVIICVGSPAARFGGYDCEELFTPIYFHNHLTDIFKKEDITELSAGIKDFSGYLEFVKERLIQYKNDGVKGIKVVGSKISFPDEAEASSVFKELISAGKNINCERQGILKDYMLNHIFKLCGEIGLVISVHSGIIWTNWQDFSLLNPLNWIPLLMKHRGTRFDMFHAGIPWIGEIGVMAKGYPNLSLNLCWCHIISQRMSIRALDEFLDLVPVNKIIAFGGDYTFPVEKVYGHLVMAKEDVAYVLGKRVDEGFIDFDEALDIADKLFYRNPKTIYSIED